MILSVPDGSDSRLSRPTPMSVVFRAHFVRAPSEKTQKTSLATLEWWCKSISIRETSEKALFSLVKFHF